MPGWVQFDRPQRCWFWLLYSCVHRCAAAAALPRAEGARGRAAVPGSANASVLQHASYSFYWVSITTRSWAQP